MYALLFVSLIFVKGVIEKLKFVAGDQKLSALIGENGLIKSFGDLNWKAFFQTILFAGKVHKRGQAAFHALIYYGFLILWIATDLVAIHYDTPFKIFKGTLYIVISFLADMAGTCHSYRTWTCVQKKIYRQTKKTFLIKTKSRKDNVRISICPRHLGLLN